MDAVIIAVAGAVLGLVCAALRGAPRSSGLGSTAAFLAGLAGTAAAIKAGQHIFAVYPATELAQVAARALAHEDERPTIVFLGTSMSRQGLDDAEATEAAAARGLEARIVSISLEGASQQERDLALKAYLRAAKRPPAALFVEITYPTDRPTYVFGVAKFSARAISQWGPMNTGWAVYGLLVDQRTGLVEWVKQAGLLGLHSGLNHLNVGALRSSAPLAALEPEASFGPNAATGPDTPSPEAVHAGLVSAAPPEARPPRWATGFRKRQADFARAQGVAIVGYYMPPTILPERRTYGAAACAELPDAPCLLADEPALLAALDGPYWFDPRHLLRPGAAIYSRWLGVTLAESGLLAPAPAAIAARPSGEGAR